MQLPTSFIFATLFASVVVANPVFPAPNLAIPKRFGGQQEGGYPSSTYPTSTSSGYPGPTGTPYDPCSGLFSEAQCCSTDVLGVADLDCASPTAVPTSPSDFQAICAKGGQIARCCVIPILDQSILCDTPVGL